MSLRIVIPAADLDTRFLPLAKVVPHELLPLGGWPLIHHALLEVEQAGLSEVTIVVSPRKRLLRRYFEADRNLEAELDARGDKRSLERLRAVRAVARRLHITFIEKETRGTGEAVLLAQRVTGDEVLGVLIADDVAEASDHWQALIDMHADHRAAGICVSPSATSDTGRYPIAECAMEDNSLQVRALISGDPFQHEGAAWRVFGRYLVTPEVLAAIEALLAHEAGEASLIDALAACIGRGPGVAAVELRGDMYDCESPATYSRSVARYIVGEARVPGPRPRVAT